jgi:ribosomal protein L6P/L9E
MKKIFFLLCLTLIIPSSSFANTEISNTRCKTINKVKIVNDNEYTCIKKKNNKNIWHKKNKVSEVKKEIFVPWSTNFKTNVMVQEAINSTNKYSSKVMLSSSYEIAIENSVKESDRKWIAQMLDYTNGFFSKVERKKIKIFLGNSHEWSKETVKNAGVWLGDPNGTYPCSNGKQDAACSGYENLVLWIFMNHPQIWDVGRRSIPAHEVFHTIQHSLLGYNTQRISPGHPRAVPRWLKEGSANYFGYYVVQKLGFDSYENGRNSQIRFNSEYRNVKPLSTYDNFESNPYGIGQAATEYIIASVGFESLLNIFKFTGTEGSFSAGFKKATGIELSEFYSKFEDARSSMQIGQ